MKDFFEQAIQAAQHGEEQSRANDIALYQSLFNKHLWDDHDFDLTIELEERAAHDRELFAQMREIEHAYLEREGLLPTPDDLEQARKQVQHIIRQWEDHKWAFRVITGNLRSHRIVELTGNLREKRVFP